ncbi:MAG: glycoside hydrolase family 43 protein [Spirochaetaceae bacterium]|nr:glycoside hydrolase family 43 protein [Spirochaetaceae bacterium]
MKYTNPVIPGFNPDPSVCRAGKTYYLVTSSFEFFPGVPIYRSTNLVNWELIGYCLNRTGQLPLENCPASRGVYAPTIRYRGGVFFMTSTNTNTRKDGNRYGNFIVHTRDICGAWSDPVYVDQGGIDPSLLFDGDTVWFCSNGGGPGQTEPGIYLCEIDPITGEKRSPSRLISKGSGAKCTEAPHIYRVKGWYFLVLAEGGTEYGHMVTVQRSRRIEGPYENCPGNPVLSNRYRHRHPVQAVGHADFFADHTGNWWLVCLGVRIIDTQELHHLGRETFLAPVRWEEAWPIADPIELEMDGPLPEPPRKTPRTVRSAFSGNALPLSWNYVRVPQPYRLRNNRLFLRGGGQTLSDPYPVFAGVRQPAFSIAASVSVSISRGAKAGIAAFYNDSYHYDLVAVWDKADPEPAVLVNRRIHDMEAVAYKSFPKFFKKDRKSIFLKKDGKSIFLGKDKKTIFLKKDRKSIFLRKNRKSVFLKKDGKSIFLGKDRKSIFLKKDRKSIFLGKNRKSIFFRKDEKKSKKRTREVELRIEADARWYYFSYRLPGGIWRDCGKAMTAGLCSEGTWRKTFTGVFIGLFAVAGEARFSGFTLRSNP